MHCLTCRCHTAAISGPTLSKVGRSGLRDGFSEAASLSAQGAAIRSSSQNLSASAAPEPGGAGRIRLRHGAAAGYEDVVTGDVRLLTDGPGRDLTA
jgi:hypothetical protein